MRRLVLFVIAFGLLGAVGMGQLSAYADTDTDVAGCLGTGGYNNGTWSFSQSNDPAVGVLPLCGIASSDDMMPTAPSPPSPPSPPSLTIPPNAPAPPTIDPNDPLGTVFSIENALCTPEPGVCDLLLEVIGRVVGLVIGSAPNPVNTMSLSLSAAGDFACGNGSLSGTGNLFPGGVEPAYNLAWTAMFTNGVGTVTGTATPYVCVPGDPECGPPPQVKTLSGQMIVGDGAPASCDDSAGNSQVGVLLTIAP